MNAARLPTILSHLVVAIGFAGYTAALLALFRRSADAGYVGVGAQLGLLLSVGTAASGVSIVLALVLWSRTGRRRLLIAIDLIVAIASWTAFVALVFLEPAAYIAVLGAQVVAVVTAIAVTPPGAASKV